MPRVLYTAPEAQADLSKAFAFAAPDIECSSLLLTRERGDPLADQLCKCCSLRIDILLIAKHHRCSIGSMPRKHFRRTNNCDSFGSTRALLRTKVKDDLHAVLCTQMKRREVVAR